MVEALAADLRRAGHDPFFDEQLTGGQPWWDRLLAEIEHCDAFIPGLSRAYVNSMPCRREADYAHVLAKPILPIMFESINPAECADYIAEAHCTWYAQHDTNLILDLMRAVMALPPAPELPDPMPVRPEIPVTYVAAALRSARDRVDAARDLSRDEQRLLLSDVKALMEPSPDAARDLLRVFRTRADLSFQVANEISALLDDDTTVELGGPAQPRPPADPARPFLAPPRLGSAAALCVVGSSALLALTLVVPGFWKRFSDSGAVGLSALHGDPGNYSAAPAYVALALTVVTAATAALRFALARRQPGTRAIRTLAWSTPALAIAAAICVAFAVTNADGAPAGSSAITSWLALALALVVVVSALVALRWRPPPDRTHAPTKSA
jgi:hypothetical protein